MPFQNQISITAQTGVGSTSLLKALQETLVGEPYRWFSGGELFRNRGFELGMDVNEFARYCLDHPEHDRYVDERIQTEAAADWMICESRLSHVFMPHAFKVLLLCDLETRAKRRHGENLHLQYEVVLDRIRRRDEDDRTRYEKLYPGCMWEERQFDLVIRSDDRENGGDGLPDVLAKLLIKRHHRWLANQSQVVVEA